MKGLYINFELKRRKKLDKIMDYIFVLAAGIIIFIILFYMPYVTRSNEYTKAEKEKLALIAEKTDMEEQILPYLPENVSVLEQNYNKAFDTIADKVTNYSSYIDDLYDCARDEDLNDGVTISGLVLTSDPLTDVTILKINLRFANNDVFYKYKDKLDGLDWVPVVIWDEVSTMTSWEVYINVAS